MDLSPASRAPPHVNGHLPTQRSFFCFLAYFLVSRFARRLKQKLVYRIPPPAEPEISELKKIDRNNYHCFSQLLVPVSGLEPLTLRV